VGDKGLSPGIRSGLVPVSDLDDPRVDRSKLASGALTTVMRWEGVSRSDHRKPPRRSDKVWHGGIEENQILVNITSRGRWFGPRCQWAYLSRWCRLEGEVTVNKSNEHDIHNRLDDVSRLLADRLEDEEGNRADPAEVEEVVRAKAEELQDARITEFVPLLTERKATDELRERGLHPAWKNLDVHQEDEITDAARQTLVRAPTGVQCETIGCNGMVPVPDDVSISDAQGPSAAVTCPACGVVYDYVPPVGNDPYCLVAMRTSDRA
jgi:hypothetical protein